MKSSNSPEPLPIAEPLNHSPSQVNNPIERVPQDPQFIEQVLQNLPGVVYLFDAIAQQPIYVSAQMRSLLGYSLEEGMAMGSEFTAKVMHPEDRARLPYHLEQLDRIPSHESLEFVYRMRRANGEWLWFSSQDRVFRRTPEGQLHQVLGIAQNITERRRAELALRESQRRYQDLAEAMPQIVWTADASGAITYFNQRWYEYSGLTEVESLGLAGTDAVHPDDRARTLEKWAQAIGAGETFEVEYQVRRWDGVYHWFICRGIPRRDEQGQLTGWIGTITDIHALKEAEQAILRNEQLVRRVLDSLFSFVGVMTPDGVLIEANHTALTAASLQPEDVLGKPFEETYWWAYSSEIQAQLKAAIQRAGQGESVRYDVQVRLGEDQFIIIDFAIVPLLDERGQVQYLIPSGIDITRRKQVEAALENSRADLQRQLLEIEAIYQTAPIGLAVLDTDLRFIRVNQRLAEINGIAAEAHIGYTVRDLLPQVANEVENLLQQVLAGTPLLDVEVNSETPAQPGVQRTWMEHWLPLRDQDQVIGISIVCEEVTERKQAEQSLRQSEAQLRQQTEQLLQANRVKDEFLAVLSHELRTPLNPILGWAKLLQTRRLDADKMQQALAAIDRNARLQVQLIDDLLDISRIIRGKLTLNLTPVSLIDPILAALETVNHAASVKGIEIEINLNPSLRKIKGDAGRLQQMMWNLLSNAIKFTPEGGRVIVSLEQVDRYAQIQVSDTGRGINPEFLPYLFEMFRQQDSSTTRQFGGLGLGLAISQQLVQAHGGTIVASSPGEGQGAAFTVRFPLMVETEKETVSALQFVQLSTLQGIRILTVDDEPDTLEFMQVCLMAEGATVLTADSAQVALSLLAHSSIDILISDIQMPDMDGYQFIRQVRSRPQFQPLPAIALTAYAYESDREMALKVGYQRHLTKPIEPTVLVQAILELLSEKA
ncbi:MAG: PAS domain S-box protein [Leptolyngbyaceae cyanobacterium bins.59]|nr:PAS domain S-box protein [Leptolyngbyaceae cyanobacterium bins.59]